MSILNKNQQQVLKVLSGVELLRDKFHLAQEKHIGMDNYWLSRAMYQIEELTFLPRMIKEIQIDTLKKFFIRKAEQLLV